MQIGNSIVQYHAQKMRLSGGVVNFFRIEQWICDPVSVFEYVPQVLTGTPLGIVKFACRCIVIRYSHSNPLVNYEVDTLTTGPAYVNTHI